MLAPGANGAWAKVRRVARRAAWILGFALVVAGVLVAGLLVYLQSAPGRRFLARQVSELVTGELVSALRIERLEVISPRRLVASRATLTDARGRTLLAVSGLEARFELSSLLAHVLFGPEVRVVVPEVRAERVEVGLYRDEHGELVLANAFEAKTPSGKPASRPLRLRLPHVVARTAVAYNDEPGLAQARTELRDLAVRLEVAPGRFELGLDTERLAIAGAVPLELEGALHGAVRIPGTTDATFSGALGTLPVAAQFELHGDELALRVSSTALAPDGMKTLIPGWPLLAPLAGSAEFRGPVAALRTHAELSSGSSRIGLTGSVTLSPEFESTLAYDARDVDLRLFAGDAPRTALAATGDFTYHARPNPRVEVTGRVLDGELAGHPLPGADVRVVYAADTLGGTLALLDRRLPLDVSFTLSPQRVLDFQARAQGLALRALEPYGVTAGGVTSVDVTGALARDELNARFDIDARALEIALLRVKTANAKGTVRGPLARPRELGFDVAARGTSFAVGKVEFPRWELTTQGTLARQVVSVRAGAPKQSSLRASATVGLAAGVIVAGAEAQVELAGTEARLEVAEARLDAGSADVRGFKLALGDGEVSGSLRAGSGGEHVNVVVSDFDPAPLFPLFELEPAPFSGRIDGRLAYDADGRERHARLRGTVENGSAGALGPLFGEVTATLDDDELAGNATVSAAGIGRGKLSARATLERGVTSLASLRTVPGEVRFEFSELDVAELEHHLAPAAPGVNGRAEGAVWLARPESNRPLEAGYELTVRDFTLESDPQKRTDPLLRVDVSSRATLAAATTRVELDVKDADGVWLRSGATLARGTTRALELFTQGHADEVLDAPLRAEIVALPRPLERFGGLKRALPRGDFSGALSVSGTPAHPHVVGSLDVRHLAFAGLAAENDVALLFDYAADREQYSLSARAAARGVNKFELTGGGHCGWFEHGFGSDLTLDARGRAEKVALAALGDVLDVKLAGELSGQAALTASASTLDASGEFAVKGLALERRELGDGSGSFKVQQGLARANLRFGDAGSKIELASELGVDWNGGAPRVDPRRGGKLAAEVRNYELGGLAPLLRSFVSDVGGPLNGFFELGFGPADVKGQRQTKLRANASVSGGTFRLTSGIGGVRNAELRALANGDGVLHVTFSGAASSKQPNVSAKADVLWEGLLPRRVRAEVRAERVPVSYEGVLLGTASIDKKAPPLGVVIDLSAGDQRVNVSVPALDFELPVKEDTRLIELTPDPTVRVTDAAVAPTATVVAAPEPSALVVAVTLGDAVRVKQPDLLVPVTGNLTRNADGRLDGALVLPEGGTVSAFGQVFRLKQSSVRFANQPVESGVLMIQASARTVEGLQVDLDVSGTVAKPVVRFRSDPPRSEGEIISMLLGIRPDDNKSVPGQQDVGGSAMALAMNQLLRNSPLAGFQFGETQSRTGDTISTVSFRAGNKVWLEGWSTRQNQGTPYEMTRSSGVVDWRFAPGFSLRTQLGYPSGVEMRWSHRY